MKKILGYPIVKHHLKVETTHKEPKGKIIIKKKGVKSRGEKEKKEEKKVERKPHHYYYSTKQGKATWNPARSWSLQENDVVDSHWILHCSICTERRGCVSKTLYGPTLESKKKKNPFNRAGWVSNSCMQPTEISRVFDLRRWLCFFRWIPGVEVVGKNGQVSWKHAVRHTYLVHPFPSFKSSIVESHVLEFILCFSFFGGWLFFFSPFIPKEERD